MDCKLTIYFLHLYKFKERVHEYFFFIEYWNYLDNILELEKLCNMFLNILEFASWFSFLVEISNIFIKLKEKQSANENEEADPRFSRSSLIFRKKINVQAFRTEQKNDV